MPPKAKKEPSSKDLYLFLVEADELKGTCDTFNHIIAKLVSDKIFTEKEDVICIRRHDDLKSFDYVAAKWDVLHEYKGKSSKPAKIPPNFIKNLTSACESLTVAGSDDAYDQYKILYFGYFDSSKLSEEDVREFRTRIETEEILLTIVFPVEQSEMSPIQLENYLIFNKILMPSEWGYVYTPKQALGRVLNMKAVKEKRSMAGKFVFHIGGSLQINVKKLIINRKHATEFKNPDKDGITKETVYTLNDGTVIGEDELGEAYLYGDELVSVTGIDDSGSGEEGASIKLLAFCPRQNIPPIYMIGDGTDIFFAQDGDTESALKMDALIKAMTNLNTVAVISKVMRKNAPVVLGILAPDLERKGLIHADLAYADDLTTPAFPPLIREGEGDDGISEKDELIDELISLKTIPDFNPEKGPVDSKLLVQREAVTRKILNMPYEGDVKNVDQSESQFKAVHNNIELYFHDLVKSKSELTDRIKTMFPLKINKETGSDRPSGKQIFRKREFKEETNGNDSKRIKMEDEANGSEQNAESAVEEPVCDMDDLLDEM